MKVLVLGASGMLGNTLSTYMLKRGHQVLTQSRAGVGNDIAADLTSSYYTAKMMREAGPDVVINLAGLTDVDRCESNPKEAWLANVRSVENVVAAIRDTEAHLVHISTDHVYDKFPRSTELEAMPGNQYAMTKYAGELAALSVPATVLRTNFFGASRHATRRSLTDWIFSSLTGNRAIQVFEDVRFSPLSMATLCEMIERVAQHRPLGVFNLGSHTGMSKADFAFAFAADLGLSDKLLTRSTTCQASFLKVWRPKDMCMDSARFEIALGAVLPSLKDEIRRAAKDYRDAI